MTQLARPDSFIESTGIAGGNYASIGEIVPDDNAFVYGVENATVIFRCGLSDITVPSVKTNHTFYYRLAKINNNVVDGGGNAVYATLSVYQGTTLIKSDVQRECTGAWVQHSCTLSESEAANITDGTILEMRLDSPPSGGNAANRRAVGISWFQFQVPDASTPDALTASDIVSGISVLGTPSIGQTHDLSSADIVSGISVFEAPTLGQTHELSSIDITSGVSVLDTPALTSGQTYDLTANDITTEPVIFEAPTLTSSGTDALTAEDIYTEAAVLETSTLTSDIIILQSKSIGKSATANEDFITLTFDNDLVEGSLVVALYMSGSSIDQGPANFSNPIDLYDAGNDDEAAIFCKVAGPSESKVITCTTVFPDEQALIIYEFAGPFESSPLDKTDIEEVSIRNTITLSTESTVQDDELALVLVSFRSNTGLISSISDNFIIGVRTGTTQFKAIASAYKKLTSSGIVSVTGNVTNSTVMAGIATFKKDISDDLTAEDIVTPAAELEQSSIGQTHYISSEDIVTPVAELEEPTIGQTHELTSANITSGIAVLEAPTLSVPQAVRPSLISYTNIQSSANSGSQAVTVPANTDCAILYFTYWHGEPDLGFTFSINGTAMTVVKLIDAYEDNDPSNTNSGYIGCYRLNNPSSGNFAWDMGGTLQPVEGFNFVIMWMQDVDTSGNPIRGFSYKGCTNAGGQQTITTSAFSTDPNDLCLVGGYSYTPINPNAAPGGSGQTEIIDVGFYNSAGLAIGSKNGVSGTTTMTFFGDYPACISISLIGISVAGDDLTADDIITQPAVLDAPTIGQTHVISSEDIVAATAVLEQPTLGQTHILSTNDLVTGSAELEAPTLTSSVIHDLTANDIVTEAVEFEASAFSQIHTLSSVDVVTEAVEFEAPTLGQTHVLNSVDITTESAELEQPSLEATDQLTADDITTEPAELEQATIGQTHVLVTNDITSGEAIFEAPSIGQTHYLSADDIVSGISELGAPIISETPSLEANDIYTNPVEIGAPTIAQTHYLLSSDIVTETVVFDAPDLTAIHALSVTDVVTDPAVLDSPTLTVTHSLSVSDLVAGIPELDAPSISQTHILSSVDIETGDVVLGAPSIAEILPDELTAEDIETLPVELGSPTFVQTHILSAVSVETLPVEFETPDLTETHALLGEDLYTSIFVLDVPTIGQTHVLLGEDIETLAALFGTPNIYIRLTPTDPDRIYEIVYENRVFLVDLESRTVDIPLEVRKIADE